MSVHSDGEGFGSTFAMDIPIMISPLTSRPTMTDIPLEGLRVSGCLLDSDSDDADDVEALRTSEVRKPSEIVPVNSADASPNFTTQKKICTSSLNVLVVDDVSLNRRMLHRLIISNFRHIAQAKDGSEAVEYVMKNKQKPDIILMDYVMPNMDGPTATKELRALGYKGMIIGVTGNAHPAEVETFLNAGATCVLTKPFRLEELYATIANY